MRARTDPSISESASSTVPRLGVEVTALEPPFDPVGLTLDRQHGGARHLRGERLGPAHAAKS